MVTRSLLSSVALILVVGTARAQPAPPPSDGATGGTVRVSYDETKTEFGKLHITAQAGYQFSGPSGGWTLSAGALFEPMKRVYLSGRALVPMIGVNDRDAAPLRLEGTLHLIAQDKPVVEFRRVTIKSTREGDMIRQTYVELPYVARKRFGIDATILVANGGAKFEQNGMEVTTTTSAFMVAAGITALNTNGYVSTVEDAGKITSFSWAVVGIEALYDIRRTYDIEPTDAGSKWGGRLWGESIIGRTYGVSARLELGKYPGQTGWLFLIGIGAGLHLL